MKKAFCIVLFIVLFAVPVYASDALGMEEQLSASGAEALSGLLPDDANRLMDEAGVGEFGAEMLDGFTVESMLSAVVDQAAKESATPLRSLGIVLGILLFTMLLDSTKDTFSGASLRGTYNAVAALAMMTAIVLPVVACIDRAAAVIEGAFVFTTAFVPVYAGVAIASGQVITGASYNAVMFSISEIISGGAGSLMIPVVKSSLALSLVSAITTKIKLAEIVNIIHKTIRWALTFCMTIFVGVLGLSTAVSGAGDSVAVKSTRFVLGSFVPVVGGALSDAYSSVLGYVRVLKASVGAFGIIAALCAFLPVILEAVLWLLCLNLCSAVGGIFENKAVESLMKAVCSAMQILLALLLCCLTILIVSTGILLASGGGSA